MNRRRFVREALGAAALVGGEALVARRALAADPARALDLIKPARARPAQDFQVPVLPTGTLALSSTRGKAVFLNFWATWCPPCKEEMPDMERLHHRYRGRGLEVLALSVDADGAAVVAPFVKTHGFTFRIGLDAKMSVASLYGVRALPSTFIIDRQGTITYLALGPRRWDGKEAWALFDSFLR
jgi:peroxiredoxin